MMDVLFEKLALFMEESHGFRYTRDGHRMEIWLSTREELPLVVSNIGNRRYIISWGNLIYEVTDETKAYRYVLRFFYMEESSITVD